MKKSTINKILFCIIGLLSVTICVLLYKIATRPRYVNPEETTAAVITELTPEMQIITSPATEAELSQEELSSEATTDNDDTMHGKTSTRVNIRDNPSDQAKVLETVEEGYEFTILEIRSDGWTRIDYQGQDGYISSMYVILVYQ